MTVPNPIARRISQTSSVRARVEPPAPYVTVTKSGRAASNCSAAFRSVARPASSFGGKNSKESSGRAARRQ